MVNLGNKVDGKNWLEINPELLWFQFSFYLGTNVELIDSAICMNPI